MVDHFFEDRWSPGAGEGGMIVDNPGHLFGEILIVDSDAIVTLMPPCYQVFDEPDATWFGYHSSAYLHQTLAMIRLCGQV